MDDDDRSRAIDGEENTPCTQVEVLLLYLVLPIALIGLVMLTALV